MLKRLQSVSMVLFLGTLFSGTISTATASGANSFATTQQAGICKGLVKDATGESVIGASVVVKGTTNGTITDFDGNFSLDGIKKGDVIVISYVGYQTQEIKWNGSPLNVILKEDSKTLSEVVVVGYGTQKKANLSGSVAMVDSKELENRPIQNVSSGLQGLMPGVAITGTNGAPGQDAGKIRVRGIGTLNEAGPYILVDGIETGTLSAVDPNDIESISVLKDAASAAIYGSKAANGVVLITTKRGKTGQTKISYSGYLSFQNATNMIERMGSYEYASLLNQALEAEGMSKRFNDTELQKFKDGNDPLYPDTDWYDLAYKTGVQHRHNVNINGGSENVKYMASLGYLNQTGILPNAGREQFNARTNLDMKINKRLSARMNLSFIKNDYSDASSAYYGGSSDQIIRQLNLIAPWIVARYDDGTWGTISDGSPIAWLDSGMKVNRDNYNFSGMAAVDYEIFDGLKLTLQGAYVNNLQKYNYFQKYIKYNENKESDPSQLDERFYKWDRTNYDALLNYNKNFGKHNIKGLLGWHTEKYNYKYQKAVRKKFPNNELTDMNAGDASTQSNEGYTAELAMISWFARINYDFAGKYLLEANIRADASSRFAEGHRWGYFPSFSGAWRISEEAFMESAKDSWLSGLKIRASWGQLGNQDALSGSNNDYYPALNTYNLDSKYAFGGSLNSGYYQRKYRLETISWEKASTWGVGVDFTLFNKLNGSLDYYNRKTTGIIMDVTVPKEFALDAYKDNVGSMRNSGIEINLSYNTKIGQVDFGIAGNFSYNKNEILDLGGGAPNKYLDATDGYSQRNKVGEAMNSYYIYRADGFFNSQEEADAYTAKYGNPFGKTFKAGDLRYVDTNKDGKLTADDREYCGSSDPKIIYGFNINAGWKGIDLSLMFNGAAGVKRLFDGYEVYGNFSGDAAHPATIWRDAWTPDNHDASMPRIFYDTNSASSSRSVQSDFWLQDTSYLRLKNLQLGYTLPKGWLNSVGVENIRIYYSVENLLTFDKMKINIDPESTSQRLSSYPLLRTHAFGVNVTF
ncbi:SusC/RagA family TonB-linked outer membrane protein [Phocaeicola vulgatus]|uniref:SusC/RagA family TonB-linked outer membrane protein n=2 Tax=Phocaeicola vulgatus TaxID=821 RepID=UPI0023079B97|nr:TonB-dependent receptor [Phocaeicola vulgatus]MDB0856991.1 TonB-dependent receptor [Phocaeicola vulgatus]MDB0861390.1 TonB-dependent receptor [Phocaeicola vulgatus]MDB0865485.1 TonB-dependent receptor [Phocaeicola vulgatus]MDB0869661.1 TonB-dependent receptor [Phocaeicola vulgatus]